MTTHMWMNIPDYDLPSAMTAMFINLIDDSENSFIEIWINTELTERMS